MKSTRGNPPGRLREHFMYCHWKAKVEIIQVGTKPLPRCDQCSMHMPVARILRHRYMDKCNKAAKWRIRRRDVEMAARFYDIEFNLYLVQPLDKIYDDCTAVWQNIMSAKLDLGEVRDDARTGRSVPQGGGNVLQGGDTSGTTFWL